MEQLKTCKVNTRKLWLSQKEAQKYLGVSKDWLKKYRSCGKLHYSMIGVTAFYIKSELDRLIVDNAVTGAQAFKKEI